LDYFKRRIAGYATLEMIQAGSKEPARWVTLLLGTSLDGKYSSLGNSRKTAT